MAKILDKKSYFLFFLSFVIVFLLDQGLKFLSLKGLRFNSEFLDLTLVLNDGVAFSMFDFLGPYLKYLHLALVVALFIYLFWQKKFLQDNIIAFGIMLSSGSSNLLDRFIHSGVVDMFFWHKWFNFAIFNLADVFINLSLVLIIVKELFFKKKPLS
ncbi:lipoprotein signal peptidase [Campylobacter sp. LR264d]|uniref:signal peptidase II n=1 Tax=Campylobacter sp. LR264d TaxID=2593544 RepID=UPI0012385BEC|nr:signal peptidase II [Campylobacter sp. LR264d]KAA6233541.1 lipoprotein signal peptidase [Campylobacter sp. LR264d]